MSFFVARLDEIEEHALPGGARRSAIREHLDVRSFGVNAYTADEGQPIVAEHTETQPLAGRHQGEPYTVGRWEPMAGFFDFYTRGDYEGGIAFLQDCLRRDPGYPGVLYNLACCESLAGRADDAVEHLRAALEGEPGLREGARDDEDLAPLRDHPRFEELVR